VPWVCKKKRVRQCVDPLINNRSPSMVYQIVVGGPKTRFIEIKQNKKKRPAGKC